MGGKSGEGNEKGPSLHFVYTMPSRSSDLFGLLLLDPVTIFYRYPVQWISPLITGS